MIIQRNDWISRIPDADLLVMLHEIIKSRRTALLPEDAYLRAFSAKLEKSCGNEGFMLRKAENVVLLEIARRYNNSFAEEYADCDEGCTTCVHEDECAEIGGRQEGRGFGSACHSPLDKPYYRRRKR